MYLKNLVFINSLEPAFSTEFPSATILRSLAGPEAVAAGGGGGGAATLAEGLFLPLDPLFFGGIFDVNLRVNLRICKQDPHHNSACLSVHVYIFLLLLLLCPISLSSICWQPITHHTYPYIYIYIVHTYIYIYIYIGYE